MKPENWVKIGFAAASLVVFFVVYQVADLCWEIFRLPLMEGWVVSPASLIGAVAGAVVYVSLNRWPLGVAFTNDVVLELSKVTWPVRKETMLSAVVVVVMTGVASVILVIFDFAWGTLSQKLLTL